MSYVIVERDGPHIKEVARVSDRAEWSGSEIVIHNVKRELIRRGFDPEDPKDLPQLPIVFWGSYFWAARIEDDSNLTKEDV